MVMEDRLGALQARHQRRIAHATHQRTNRTRKIRRTRGAEAGCTPSTWGFARNVARRASARSGGVQCRTERKHSGGMHMNYFEQQIFLLAEDNESDVLLMKEAFFKADIPNPLQIVDGGDKAIAYLSGVAPYN